MGFHTATLCLHSEEETVNCDHSGAVSFPIYQTATFSHRNLGENTGYDYSRIQNPTREKLENVVASLEKGCEAIAFSSGTTAIGALIELFHAGDEVLTYFDLYGGTIRMFDTFGKNHGVKFRYVDFIHEDIETYIGEQTKAIFIETPTNPMMHILDIRGLHTIAKKHRLLLIVDNTFLSPYFQNPLELGADIVIHSGTKYLCGHNDAIAGFLIVKEEELAGRLRRIYQIAGTALAPFDSWLILRGIKTLPLRMEQAQKNAFAIVDWLKENPEVKQVYYPGIEDSDGYEISLAQSSGFGGMVSFELRTKEAAVTVLEHLKLILFAESLGGVDSLMTYPITQTHAEVPKELLDQNGINDRLLRMSVGIENIEDLIADLEQAFSYIKG